MGKGKLHGGRGGRGQEEPGDGGGILNMDPDGPYRTHLLFPGRKDEMDDPRRPGGSPSFMKQMLQWGKKSSEARMMPQQEMQKYRVTPEQDPYFRSKQVSFMEGEEGRMMFERPERRGNSYHCDKPPSTAHKYVPASFSEPFREGELSPNAGPGPPPGQGHGGKSGGGGGGGAVSGLLAAVGGQAAAAATGGKLTRAPACDPFAVNGGGPPREDGRLVPRRRRGRGDDTPQDIHGIHKDCFIIPQENLERFLPNGITWDQGEGKIHADIFPCIVPFPHRSQRR